MVRQREERREGNLCMRWKEQLRPDSNNPIVVGLRLGTGVLATLAGVWIIIVGSERDSYWLILLGIVMLILGFMALSSGFVG